MTPTETAPRETFYWHAGNVYHSDGALEADDHTLSQAQEIARELGAVLLVGLPPSRAKRTADTEKSHP